MPARRPPAARQAAASRNSVSALACLKVTLAVIVAVVAVAYGAWREHMLNDYLPAQYHRQQVCPPPEDRFHDHCMEGRTHFAIEVDTDCLDQAGAGKSAALRGVFGVSEDASGVFTALRWLAESDAAFLGKAPCVKSLKADRNCRLCVFTPRPEEPNATAADDAAAPAADASPAESGAADQT